MSEDDVEAFLYVFKRTATTAQWPASQWVTILGHYLTGPMSVMLHHSMPIQDIVHYNMVKVAILDCYEIMEETW